MRGLGRRALGRTHEDLFNEAIFAVLDGKRCWNPSKVDFVGFLLGAMQSISDNWSRRYKDSEPLLECDLEHVSPTGNTINYFQSARAEPAMQEATLFARDWQTAVEHLFENDPLASIIICELKEGLKLREIREKYHLSQTDYETALKRLRRKLSGLESAVGSR